MSSIGFRPAGPDDDIPLGNVRDDAQVDAAKDDKDADGILSKEEAYVGNANRLPRGSTLPRFDRFKPGVPVEHDVKPASTPQYPGAGRYLLSSSAHLGDFHVDGMGFGNARFKRGPAESGQGDRGWFVLDLGGFDSGMLMDKDTKLRVVVAARDFKPDDDRLGRPDAVILPMSVEVSPAGYSRAGYYPPSYAAHTSVDVAKLRELAEGNEPLGFYVEIEAKGHGKRYLNLDGVAGRNFVVSADKIR